MFGINIFPTFDKFKSKKVRFWSLFICTIVIALSFAPCADAAIRHNKTRSDITTFNHSSSENHKNTKGDACSPFCVCTCCNVPTFLYRTMFPTNVVIFLQVAYPNARPDKVVSTPLEIWQPPQLG
ncbi:DUF6660 family protein [Pedobacter helvus]|uniref:DUF6660 family protein n=1 Tax=Pedobacter helvus TaxID=2563444 RepID=A0ABW9JMT2_9SPHI|nr:DUF6660 family protein [Pedobacter ureilyticus]